MRGSPARFRDDATTRPCASTTWTRLSSPRGTASNRGMSPFEIPVVMSRARSWTALPTLWVSDARCARTSRTPPPIKRRADHEQGQPT